MAITLVTGGTGFIGSAIVRALIKRGGNVRVLARKTSDPRHLKGLPIQISYGDVYFPESLPEALKGVDTVYHTASVYKFFPWWKRKIPPIYKTNIKGTKNLIAASKQAGIKRFIYTSSIITTGVHPSGGYSDETTPLVDGQLNSHYAKTKYGAEKLVIEETRKGFPAVIVNPGLVFGERDGRPTPTGEVVLKFLKRIYPGYFNSIWPVADVNDIAEAHLAACEKGKIGEKYILCNKNHYSMKEIFKILSKIARIPAPFIRIPYSLLMGFVYSDEWSTQWVPHQPLLSSEGVKFCRNFLKCDNAKAVRELSYRETPFEESLERQVRWYWDHGYARRSPAFRQDAVKMGLK